MRVSLFYFTFLSVNGILLFYFGPYLKALGLNLNEVGIICAVTPALLTFVPLIWGSVADRSGKTVLLIRVAIVGLAAALVLMTFANSYLSIFVAWTIYSFFYRSYSPIN